MLRLVIEDDEGKTTVVPLIRDEITIGRKEGNTIRLTERNVSRRHARLLRTDGTLSTVQVEDLESYNGVRLNGTRISDRATVRPGDLLQIGDYSLAVKSDRPADAEDDAAPAATQVHPLEAENLPESERGKLVVVSSNLAGETFPLDRREIIVGRTDENDVVINHRSISRNHAKLIVRDGSFTIIDLASSNGVKVNGEPFGTSALLNGDILELGHVKLRFVGPGDTYVFTRADIDDVEVDGGLPLGRLLFFLVLLLAAAAVTYFMVQPKPDPGSQQVRPAGGGALASADAPAQPPPMAPAAAPAIGPLLDEGRGHLDRRAWKTAEAVFQRVLDDHPEHDEARKLKQHATAELANERAYKEIQSDINDKQFGDAYFKIADFPDSSVYADELARLRPTVEQAYADEELERGRRFAERQRSLDDARKILALLRSRPFAERQAKTLAAIIEAQEAPPTEPAAATAPRKPRRPRSEVEPLKPPPVGSDAPSPGVANAHMITEDAVRLMSQGQRAEAIEQLKKATQLDPASPRAYSLLCEFQKNQGLLPQALHNCKLWRAKERNEAGRTKAAEKVRALEQELAP